MPVFRINKDLHYFAHVPKCGGTSVEAYLKERFGPLGMYEANRYDVPAHQRWTRTSLVHVPVARLASIYPIEWFASSFAVVRHPVRRLVSAFFFARDATHAIPPETAFDAWFQETAPRLQKEPYLYGGHLVPQTDQIPDNARIFRFEDGLEAVVAHLDALAGNTDGPRELPSRNVGRWRGSEDAPVPTPETLSLIARVYAEDYSRFGYPIITDTVDAKTIAALPTLVATGRPPERPRLSLKRRIRRYLLRKAGM